MVLKKLLLNSMGSLDFNGGELPKLLPSNPGLLFLGSKRLQKQDVGDRNQNPDFWDN